MNNKLRTFLVASTLIGAGAATEYTRHRFLDNKIPDKDRPLLNNVMQASAEHINVFSARLDSNRVAIKTDGTISEKTAESLLADSFVPMVEEFTTKEPKLTVEKKKRWFRGDMVDVCAIINGRTYVLRSIPFDL